MRNYTPQEIRFLEDHVAGRSYAALTELFNERFGQRLSVERIKHFLHTQGLSNGMPQRYQKGHVSCFKGKKLPWLKRKNPEYNRKPIGTIKLKDGYTLVKVADDPSRWKPKHHLVWEAAHGPIPNGYAVLFADRNKSHYNLDNLLLVSRAELVTMNRNHLIGATRELTIIGKNIAVLKLLIRKREQMWRGRTPERRRCVEAGGILMTATERKEQHGEKKEHSIC